MGAHIDKIVGTSPALQDRSAKSISQWGPEILRLSGAACLSGRDADVIHHVVRQLDDLAALQRQCDQARVSIGQGLDYFRVSLKEDPSDKFTIAFECWAEDAEHAYEQAENAYPGCALGTAAEIGWHPGFSNVDSLANLMRLLAEDRHSALGYNNLAAALSMGADAVQRVKQEWERFEKAREAEEWPVIHLPQETFFVYSPNEAALSGDGAGFWSNEDGWTIEECATVFTAQERGELNLPMSTGGDARWVRAYPGVPVDGGRSDGLSPRPAEG